MFLYRHLKAPDTHGGLVASELSILELQDELLDRLSEHLVRYGQLRDNDHDEIVTRTQAVLLSIARCAQSPTANQSVRKAVWRTKQREVSKVSLAFRDEMKAYLNGLTRLSKRERFNILSFIHGIVAQMTSPVTDLLARREQSSSR
jgi:hypothetical protein